MTTPTTTDAAPARPTPAGRPAGAARPAAAERPARPASRPHGQWKVDGTEPLNANEEWKQEDGGLAVRERIETIYAAGGFASIDPTDLHGRFRWWGLYTQRKPGIDGGKTATLEPHELEDEYFMLRVRIDGGQLTTEQLRVIGGISTEFGRDTADLTDRQNIQLHWVARRGRARDLAPARGRRTLDHRGVRRRAARRARLARRRHRRRRAHRPDARDRRDHGALHRRPRAREPAAQVQDRDHRPPQPGRRARDQRRRVRRGRPPRARHRLRPLGRRRPLDGAAPRRAPRRLRRARAGARRLARRHLDLPRLRLPAPAQQGAPEVPRSPTGAPRSSARCSRPSTSARRCPTARRAPKPLTQGDHVGVHRQKDGRFYVGATPIVGRVSGSTLTASPT